MTNISAIIWGFLKSMYKTNLFSTAQKISIMASCLTVIEHASIEHSQWLEECWKEY